MEIRLTLDPEVAAAELDAFHLQQGGERLQPELKRVDTQSTLIEFHIIDGKSVAAISFRPAHGGGSLMTIEYNESERWVMKLGIPGRSELGRTT